MVDAAKTPQILEHVQQSLNLTVYDTKCAPANPPVLCTCHLPRCLHAAVTVFSRLPPTLSLTPAQPTTRALALVAHRVLTSRGCDWDSRLDGRSDEGEVWCNTPVYQNAACTSHQPTALRWC
jgi:hypothetical protein